MKSKPLHFIKKGKYYLINYFRSNLFRLNLLLNKFKTSGNMSSNTKEKNNKSKKKEQNERNKSFKSTENLDSTTTIKNLESNFEKIANENTANRVNPHLKV